MKRRKSTLNDYIDAILARDEGFPYEDVIEGHHLSPTQFYKAVIHNLHDFILNSRGEIKSKLIEISEDKDRIKEMFNMGEECVQGQYDRIEMGTQKSFYYGSFLHSENVKNIVYYALGYHNSLLKSRDRKDVVKGVNNLPINLREYFINIRLSGLLQIGLIKNWSISLLEVFDKVYQEKTEDFSLFDLSQPVHLHKWDVTGRAPNYYWKNPSNVEEVVYHILTENHPKLASSKREDVTDGIRNLPTALFEYFINIGLSGLIQKGLRDISLLPFLEVFDKRYQKNTGDKSLFDLSQPIHLHKWDFGHQVPHGYWENQINVEEAVYHTLTENHPELNSTDRKKVIERIKNLPKNKAEHFHVLGLESLMMGAFEKGRYNSPLAVLGVFDKVYQEKTKDKSLFDLSQEHHLHKWGKELQASKSYWKNRYNVEEAIYHTLTENHPSLDSIKRESVIEEIMKLPSNLAEHFHKIGLSGLMGVAFKKNKRGSPLAVLEVFDGVYQEKTKDFSLFDLSQKKHLHKWGDKFQAPKSYWRNHTNVEEAVYHLLTENHPKLSSHNRKEIIEGINELPIQLYDHLENIGLSNLFTSMSLNPLDLLKIFDEVYQEKIKDKSLFDLNQKEHLHRWEIGGSVPNSYWQNSTNIDEAVYHTLTEDNPTLSSNDRKKVIEGIKNLPNQLQNYFVELGLSSLMAQTLKTPTFKDGITASPLAILEIFNGVYQEKTKDKSLFDLTQSEHLHRWEVAGHVPNLYWETPTNVEEAIYHTLTENHAKLCSNKREEVIDGLKGLPKRLEEYFHKCGFGGLIMRDFRKKGLKDSSPFILNVFDQVYQKINRDASLFDTTQEIYLEFGKQNRLIR